MKGSIVGGNRGDRGAAPTRRAARAIGMFAGILTVLAAGGAGLGGAVAAPQSAADEAAYPEYRIGPGDELSVDFPLNGELNHDGPVGPDGRFTMPQIGTVLVAGATVDEAARRIATVLRRDGIVQDARPTIAIRQYAAAVYVGGEVKLPGAVKLNGDMDAMKAVIVAGGLLDTAKSKRVVVIRRGADGVAQMHYIDLRAYARHGTGAGALTLQPQDIVFVPKSSIAEVNVWIDQHINRLLPFSRSVNYTIGNGTLNTIAPR